MSAQYDPRQIRVLRQILDQAPGLTLLWLTGLEHAPWFEESQGRELIDRLDNTAPEALTDWLSQHLRHYAVEGDFLLHLDDLSNVPWVRVLLSSDHTWLPVLLNHTRTLAFVSPNYTLRLDIVADAQGCAVYVQRHSPFDLDADAPDDEDEDEG